MTIENIDINNIANEAIKDNNIDLIKNIMKSECVTEEFYYFNSPIVNALMYKNDIIFSFLITIDKFNLTDCQNDLFSDCVGMFNENGNNYYYKELLKIKKVATTINVKDYEYSKMVKDDIMKAQNFFKVNDSIKDF